MRPSYESNSLSTSGDTKFILVSSVDDGLVIPSDYEAKIGDTP